MPISDAEQNEVREIVRNELIGILDDAKAALGVTKDPTGFGRKAIEGMISMIQKRGSENQETEVEE